MVRCLAKGCGNDAAPVIRIGSAIVSVTEVVWGAVMISATGYARARQVTVQKRATNAIADATLWVLAAATNHATTAAHAKHAPPPDTEPVLVMVLA